ncbi:MAG: TetR family transcriptional regulator [Firmicutes bacterium]|jgi:AcrR family transcriptional regulator|nr:TetR family transcriptional regulator [Bacillota bacterium]
MIEERRVMKFMSKQNTKSRIIAAAIEMMGREGNINATVRDIAGRADVNLASINYYFRSKDNLQSELEAHFSRETEAIYRILYDAGKTLEERLHEWADRMMKHLIDYPGVLFMLADRIVSSGQESSGIIELIDYSEANLELVIREATGETDGQKIAIGVMLLMSGIINPVLLYHGSGKMPKADISDAKVRKKLIDQLLSCVLGS